MTDVQRQLLNEHLPKFTRDFDRSEVLDRLRAAGVLNDDQVRTVSGGSQLSLYHIQLHMRLVIFFNIDTSDARSSGLRRLFNDRITNARAERVCALLQCAYGIWTGTFGYISQAGLAGRGLEVNPNI
jgi:hypothetical protein